MGRIWAHFPVENHRIIEIIESELADVSTQSKKSEGDDQRWKSDRFLVPFRRGALFSVASYPVPASAPNPRSERPPRTPGEMQT